MPFNREELLRLGAKLGREAAAHQGLPEKLEDPETIARIAAIVKASPAPAKQSAA